MTGKERYARWEFVLTQNLPRADSILRRQNSGKITPWEASYELDLLMMSEGDGHLVYYSDSTGITADWDPDVMLFPKPGSRIKERIPSNTGIYARGPKRGFLITRPAGTEPDCMPEVLEHFSRGSKGWDGGYYYDGEAKRDS